MTLKFASNISFMFKEAGEITLRYNAAKKCGFKAVESAFPVGYSVADVQSALHSSGLKQVLLNAHPGEPQHGGKGLAALPGLEEQFKDSLETSISYCNALNCQRLHVMSGVVPRSQGEATFERNMRYVAARLAQEDIVALIEPISPQAVPGYFLNDYTYALEVVRKIGSDRLRLQVDLFHLQNICGNISDNLAALLPFTGHIQVAQVPHRHEPGIAGELDLRYVFGLLEKHGYSGWVGCEYVPSTPDSGASLGWVSDMGYSL